MKKGYTPAFFLFGMRCSLANLVLVRISILREKSGHRGGRCLRSVFSRTGNSPPPFSSCSWPRTDKAGTGDRDPLPRTGGLEDLLFSFFLSHFFQSVFFILFFVEYNPRSCILSLNDREHWKKNYRLF